MQKPTARILLMAAAGAIAASLVSGVMGWPAVDGVRRDSSVYRDARGVKFPDVGWRVTFTTGDVMEVPMGLCAS